MLPSETRQPSYSRSISQHWIIKKKQEAGQAGETAVVSFTNEHDGRTNGGYGVKNNFKLDENGQYQYTEPAAKN